MDGYQLLAIAVLKQAVRDLHDPEPYLRRRARAWLTDGQTLATWCAMAGLEAGAVASRVRRMG